jgi:hypothetical protein
MFFGSRKHGSARGNDCGSGWSEAETHESGQGQTDQLQDWRRSAQRVTRAWNAWLAADGRDRGVRYRAFVAALGDEERAAAEVERMIQLPETGECVTTNRSAG